MMPHCRVFSGVKNHQRTDAGIGRHEQRFGRQAGRQILEPHLDGSAKARPSLHINVDNRAAPAIDTGRVRSEIHDKVRLRRTNRESVGKVLSVPFEQVADFDPIFARLAKALLDPSVGADGVVVLLDDSPFGVHQVKHCVQRRTKPARFDLDHVSLVFFDLEFELVHVFGAVDPTVDDHGRVHYVRVVGGVVRFVLEHLRQVTDIEKNRVRIAFGGVGADFLLAQGRAGFDSQFHFLQAVQTAPAQPDFD